MSGVRHAPHIEKPMKRPATSTESHREPQRERDQRHQFAAQVIAAKAGEDNGVGDRRREQQHFQAEAYEHPDAQDMERIEQCAVKAQSSAVLI